MSSYISEQTIKRSNSYLSRRHFLKLAGGATAGVLVLGACGPVPIPSTSDSNLATESASNEPSSGGILRVAYSGSPAMLDPALSSSNEDYGIGFSVYEGLVEIGPSLIPQPALAESWETAEDGLSWTFALRKGVTFHHGAEFNAADVVHTFGRILNPDFGSPLRSTVTFLDSVEAIDDYTVRFNLNSANADLAFITGSPQAKIVPHDYTDEQLIQETSGTGPFKLTEYVPGDHSTMVRNDDYWGDKAYLDEIRLLPMPEAATQVAALSGGTIDLIWQLGPENIPALDGNPDTTVLEVPSGLYQTIVTRATEPPFDDMRIRQALKFCVDRPGMLQVVLQGQGDLANDHPVSPVSPFYAEGLAIREQNIEKAKALLAEAGYGDGLDLTLFTSPVRPGLVESAVAFQEMVKPAGINIEIEQVPPDNYWSEYWMQVPFFTSNWNFRPSTDETLTIGYTSDAKWNEGDWRNAEYDELLTMARSENNSEKRKELYAEAQTLLHNEGAVIISYFKPALQATRSNVQGFTPHPTTWLNLRSVWLSE